MRTHMEGQTGQPQPMDDAFSLSNFHKRYLDEESSESNNLRANRLKSVIGSR